MKKILLIFTLFIGGFLSAQGNGDYVNMTFVKTTPGEDYGTILNEKWKELAQMRADEGTITGWDVGGDQDLQRIQTGTCLLLQLLKIQIA